MIERGAGEEGGGNFNVITFFGPLCTGALDMSVKSVFLVLLQMFIKCIFHCVKCIFWYF